MELTGYVIGDDLYGQTKRVEIKREVDHVPDLDEIEVRGIFELKMVSLDVRERRKIIGSIDWSNMGSFDEEHVYGLL